MTSDLIREFVEFFDKLIILSIHFISASLESRDNKTFAYILSFLFPGIGVLYLGNEMKGFAIFFVSIILVPLRIYTSIGLLFSALSFLIWLYGMYATYRELELIN